MGVTITLAFVTNNILPGGTEMWITGEAQSSRISTAAVPGMPSEVASQARNLITIRLANDSTLQRFLDEQESMGVNLSNLDFGNNLDEIIQMMTDAEYDVDDRDNIQIVASMSEIDVERQYEMKVYIAFLHYYFGRKVTESEIQAAINYQNGIATPEQVSMLKTSANSSNIDFDNNEDLKVTTNQGEWNLGNKVLFIADNVLNEGETPYNQRVSVSTPLNPVSFRDDATIVRGIDANFRIWGSDDSFISALATLLEGAGLVNNTEEFRQMYSQYLIAFIRMESGGITGLSSTESITQD